MKTELTRQMQEHVRNTFQRYQDGDRTAFMYDPDGHAIDEASNDNIPLSVLEECMTQGELIECHWEAKFQALKMIFLCEADHLPQFHVVCYVWDSRVMVKTVYAAFPDKWINGRIRRRSRKQ